jgi:hypothetical protein
MEVAFVSSDPLRECVEDIVVVGEWSAQVKMRLRDLRRFVLRRDGSSAAKLGAPVP